MGYSSQPEGAGDTGQWLNICILCSVPMQQNPTKTAITTNAIKSGVLVMPATGGLLLEDMEFKASLGYICPSPIWGTRDLGAREGGRDGKNGNEWPFKGWMQKSWKTPFTEGKV